MITFFAKSPEGLFASRSLAAHLVRGAVALILLVFAIRGQSEYPALSAMGGLAALVAMRGCPACWAIGLVETALQKVRRRRGRPS